MRAADDFDAIDVFRRERGEVEEAAGLVQRNAVEQHFVVGALASPHEDGRQIADAARAHGGDPGRQAEQIDERERVTLVDLGAIDHGDRRPHLRGGLFAARGSDDDGLAQMGRLRGSRRSAGAALRADGGGG